MQPLFARIDLEAFMKEFNAKQEVKKEQPKEEDLIGIEDFAKVELKVGTITECKKHPKADRLLVVWFLEERPDDVRARMGQEGSESFPAGSGGQGRGKKLHRHGLCQAAKLHDLLSV